MLTELRLSNFRCFKDMRSLDEMTSVFIGDNAQGKTTILDMSFNEITIPRASKNTDQIKLGEPNLSVEGMLSGKKILLCLIKE